jgi:hypothetical protein
MFRYATVRTFCSFPIKIIDLSHHHSAWQAGGSHLQKHCRSKHSLTAIPSVTATRLFVLTLPRRIRLAHWTLTASCTRKPPRPQPAPAALPTPPSPSFASLAVTSPGSPWRIAAGTSVLDPVDTQDRAPSNGSRVRPRRMNRVDPSKRTTRTPRNDHHQWTFPRRYRVVTASTRSDEAGNLRLAEGKSSTL